MAGLAGGGSDRARRVNLAAGCRLTGASHTAAAANSVIPWQDRPADAPTKLARREPRPQRPACRAEALGVRGWVEPGTSTANGESHTALLSNTSDSRCTLGGSAELVATEAATGRRHTIPIGIEQPTPYGSKQYPATIDPGEPARIDLTSVRSCASPAGQVTRYQRVGLLVLGREIPVGDVELSTACPLQVGSWYVLPPLLNLPAQLVSIEAPAEVKRGAELRYVVSILNPSERSLSLKPCPVYTQRLGEESSSYRLNCRIERLAPHQTARFEMIMRVPPTAATGEHQLSWMAAMEDGLVAIANQDTGGVPIRVIP
jgi:hypothetical protein